MSRFISLSICVLSLFWSACSEPGEERPTSTDEAIIGGSSTTDWDSAVMLYNQIGSTCSGVVVAPRVVLTAGYCIEGAAPADVHVWWCDDCMAAQDATMTAAELHLDPDYDVAAGTGLIGVVVLPQDAPYPPIQVNTDPPDKSWAGPSTPLTLVGFGGEGPVE